MKLLAVVTPLSIYHGCSTQKKLWEEIFTQRNIENCGHNHVRKHRDQKRRALRRIVHIIEFW